MSSMVEGQEVAGPWGTAACRHLCFLGGVCVQCKKRAEDRTLGIAVDYLCKGARLTTWGLDHARKATTMTLLKEKKLALVLDIDNTLLHSKHIRNVTNNEENYLLRLWLSDGSVRGSLIRSGNVWAKLRPFVREFLQEASTMFNMYLYTMGSRGYALKMAKILDPEGAYFKFKIISRGDCTNPKQKGLDVVLAEEKMVLILDDTKEVWKGYERNLIVVPGYKFFATKEACRRCDIQGKSLSDLLVDVRNESDSVLAKKLSLLKLVHGRFFDPGLEDVVSSQEAPDLLKKIRETSDQ